MTDSPTRSATEISTADVKHKSKRFSAIWVIPIVAAVIGGWMVFNNLLHEKPVVEVTFKSAAGIEAGKTLVKLRDVTIGKVIKVKHADDLATIVVTLQFDEINTKEINDSTRFWVIKPRIGIGGVSGLDTLLSGAYIEADPGEGGKPTTKFVGMEKPGIYQLGNPGTEYTLKASVLGSLSRGSPIKYRGIKVGNVTRYKLAKNSAAVDIDIFIRAPFDKLVKQDTRFWNISGFQIDADAQGVNVHMDSVATLIAGGIAFSNLDSSSGMQSKAKSVFNLYQTENEETTIMETAFNVPFNLYFKEGVNGLLAGAPVEYKGLRLGTVKKVSAKLNEDKSDMLTFASISIEPDRLPTEVSRSGHSNEERTKAVHQFLEKLVAQGVRAQLKTGNLLTGKALVVLTHFPDAKLASIKHVDGVAILPTVPESLADVMQKLDGIMTKANEILAKIDAIPVTEIGNDLSGTLQSIDSLVRSLDAARGGVLGVQSQEALIEMGRAAHALRGMAEYLERHPEALLKGKQN